MADLKQMLEEIRMEVDYTSRMIGRTAFDERVMDAMATVPRHAFVPPEMQSRAYINGPLPIGDGQTISQPYIVALMTDLLDPEPDHVILEVGTGSGYQAAVLSQLVSKVYSIEIIEKLSHQAAATLSALGYDNVVCRVADGYHGWDEFSPFDGIIVTAAAPSIPPPLVDQLKPGGKLVIPVGMAHFHQELMLVEKGESGEIGTRDVLGVAFVPLTGGHGNPDYE
ncbi:MAG: protein-L-isoaspartate(D-aspartate) O-methyltransferase [Candidatus Sedimenticola sp. 20ELBAFRAG]